MKRTAAILLVLMLAMLPGFLAPAESNQSGTPGKVLILPPLPDGSDAGSILPAQSDDTTGAGSALPVQSDGPGGGADLPDSSYGPGGISNETNEADYSGGPGSSGGPGASYGPGSLDQSAAVSTAAAPEPDYGPGDVIGELAAAAANTAVTGPGGPSSPGGSSPGSKKSTYERKSPLTPKYGYKIPAGLEHVSATAAGVPAPELPPPAKVTSFTVTDGTVYAQLDQPVRKLKIFEVENASGTESTVFSRKDVSSAEAHVISDGSTVFKVRMPETLGNAEYVREYFARSGQASFLRCTVTETLDAAACAPFTSGVRTLYYDENNILVTELITVQNEDESFSRVCGYDPAGNLTYVRQTWRALEKKGFTDGYILDLVLDSKGEPTAVMLKSDKADFLFRSQRADEDLLSARSVRTTSRDIYAFDAKLTAKYPVLAEGIAAVQSGLATPTDLSAVEEDPVETVQPPENTLIWSLSYNRYPKATVLVFATENPLFVVRKNKIVPDSYARDINGDFMRIKVALKSDTPPVDLVTIE